MILFRIGNLAGLACNRVTARNWFIQHPVAVRVQGVPDDLGLKLRIDVVCRFLPVCTVFRQHLMLSEWQPTQDTRPGEYYPAFKAHVAAQARTCRRMR